MRPRNHRPDGVGGVDAATLEPAPSSLDPSAPVIAERLDVGARLGIASLEGFRPDVQALRGLAVLAVVLFHAKVLLPGGYVGVDVFFVISGFVIGRRLVARLAGPGTRVMVQFYAHRARRILPALGVMLAIVILVAPLLAPIGGVSETSPTGVATALFSANAYLYEASNVGYFAPAADLNPLLHTWSLSVEEQFYFVIPLLLLVTWRLGRRRWGALTTIRALVAVLALSSLVLCVWLSSADGTVWRVNGLRFAFFSPFTRAWEFAAGVALVLLPVRFLAGPRLRPVLVAVGVTMICLAARVYTDATVFPGLAALLPVAGTALAIHAGTTAGSPDPRAAPAALRPMTWMGDLSYSWYLWHWPIIVFAGGFWPGGGSFPLVVAAALSLVPAWLSYRGLERRLRATPNSRMPATLALAACCIVAPLIAAALARPISSFVDRKAAESFAAVRDLATNQAGARGACDATVPINQRTTGACTWGEGDGRASVVLIGDSNAAQFDEALIGAADATGSRLEIATLRTCPFADVRYDLPPQVTSETTPGQCRRFINGSLDALEESPPDVVVIATSTDQYVYMDPILMVDPTTGERATDTGTKSRIFEDALVRLMTRLRAAGSRVVLVDVIPKPYTWDLRDCSNLTVLVDVTRCLPAQFAVDVHHEPGAANTLQARAAQRAGAETWNFNAEICPAGTCRSVRHGRLVWSDPEHISPITSRALVPTAGRYLSRDL